MKTSSALLVAWIVLLAGLAAAIVFFVLKGQSSQGPLVDEPTVAVQPKPKVPAPTRDPRSGDRRGPDRSAKKPPVPPRAPEVTGTVKTAAGEPVAGASVTAFAPTKAGLPDTPPNAEEQRLVNSVICIPVDEYDFARSLDTWTGASSNESEDAGAPLGSTASREDGTFTLALPMTAGQGPYRLSAVKDGVGSATAAEVKAGAHLDLTIGVAASVSGVVITEVDSVPVAGARVTFDDNSGRRFSAAAGEDGKFRVEGVTPGIYTLAVSARGKTPLFMNGFRVGPADLAPYTLRMPRGTTLRVRAVVSGSDVMPGAPRAARPTGTPIPDAQIVLYCEDTYTYAIAKTDAEGVAEFPGMPAGLWFANGMAKGFVPSGEETVKIDANQLVQEESIEFEVAVETPIEVVDDDGRPVAGVRFFSLNNDDVYDALRSLEVGVTDADGRMKFPFEFDGPRAALYGFKDGYALVHACPEDYETPDLLRLVAKKAVKVRGRVSTPDGAAVPDAIVTLTVTPTDPNAFMDHELVLRTDRDGRYEFPYLPRSEGISVAASAPDGFAEDDRELELVAGQDDYEVNLEVDVDVVPPPPIPVKRAPAPGQPSQRDPPKPPPK